MDNIPFIFDDTTDFPYVGLIQQEKEISESLVSMPLDYLRQNYEAFDDIVGILSLSHQEGPWTGGDRRGGAGGIGRGVGVVRAGAARDGVF